MSERDQQRLVCVLDFVAASPPDCACWLWPERSKPEPIKADDLRTWLARWSADRTCYRARRAR